MAGKNEVKILITGDASKFAKAAGDAESKLSSFTAHVSGMGGKLSGAFSSFLGNLGAIATTAGVSGLVDIGKDALAEAEEAQKVSGITNQLVKQTGANAWISSKAIGDLATSISNKVGIDDEAIQSGENVLLTFKAVRNEVGKGNDIFDRATRAAVDLSAVMGGDLEGANKMLGKALQDPVKGLTAMTRAGVSFSQSQKDQVKHLVETGHTLEAQKLILKEVEGQVGGTAAAGATATEKLSVMWKNVEEQLGTAFLPVITTVTEWIGDHLPGAISRISEVWGKIWPKVKSAWESVGLPVFDAIIDGWGQVWHQIQAAWSSIGRPVFDAIGGVISHIGDLFSGGGAGGKVSSGLASALGGLRSVWDRVGKPVIDIIKAEWATLAKWWSDNGPAITSKIGEIIGKIEPVLSGLVDIVSSVLGFVKGLWERFGDDILRVVKGAWDAVSGVVSAALDVIKGIVDVVMGLIHGDWSRVWDGIKGIVEGVWNAIVAVVQGAWGVLSGVLGAIYDGIKGILGAAWGWLSGAVKDAWDAVVGLFQGAWGRIVAVLSAIGSSIVNVLTGAWDWLSNTARAAVDAVVSFFSGMWGRITGAIAAVVTGIKNGLSAAWEWMKSTAKGAIDWVAGVFSGLGSRLAGALRSVGSLIVAPFKTAFNAISSAWNGTVGKLRFTFPSWIPGIGGKTVAAPTLPVLRALGGLIPGQGNTDSVPAMLTPGEFVIRKSSAEKLGPQVLGRLNAGEVPQMFAGGGHVLAAPGDTPLLRYALETGARRSGDGNLVDRIDRLADFLHAKHVPHDTFRPPAIGGLTIHRDPRLRSLGWFWNTQLTALSPEGGAPPLWLADPMWNRKRATLVDLASYLHRAGYASLDGQRLPPAGSSQAAAFLNSFPKNPRPGQGTDVGGGHFNYDGATWVVIPPSPTPGTIVSWQGRSWDYNLDGQHPDQWKDISYPSQGWRHFAAGGRPPVGTDVVVGENGPEIARFDQPARIYPNGITPPAAAQAEPLIINLQFGDIITQARNGRELMSEIERLCEDGTIRAQLQRALAIN